MATIFEWEPYYTTSNNTTYDGTNWTAIYNDEHKVDDAAPWYPDRLDNPDPDDNVTLDDILFDDDETYEMKKQGMKLYIATPGNVQWDNLDLQPGNVIWANSTSDVKVLNGS